MDPDESPTPKDNLIFLPPALRGQASKMAPGERHKLLTLPPEGEGHNAGLIKVASICFRMGVSFEDTVAHLSEIYSEDRIDHRTAPHRAATRVWQHEGEVPQGTEGQTEPLPDIQEELLLRFRRTPFGELVEASPAKLNPSPRKIIGALFEKDDIINIQHGRFEAGTLVLAGDVLAGKVEDLASYKFLNPSTFKKIEGVPNPLDKDLKIATRCNANVKDRPFMVLEMDSKDDAALERFTTFALTLATFAPLVMAVDTGNKSIHFWFDARKAKPATMAAVFALACLHGADKSLGVKSQIARMPNVSASEEGRGAQRLLYFDPEGEKQPDGGKWDLKGFEDFIQKARQLDFYYLGDNARYYGQSNAEAWISLNRGSLANQMVRRGFRANKMEGELLSPVDELIAGFEMDKSIEAALKGASGRHAGYYEENGFRFLVLKSPRFIKPRKGPWPVIDGFLSHLLNAKADPVQLDVFYGWLASSMRDLRNGGKRRALFTPAQMLHIIGPPDSGKSLLLKFILPACFGGRSADADALFEDKGASFNSDMFQSELLYLDDSDVLRPDHAFRAKFGERIKSFTVGAGGSYHQKFGDKVPVPPWWRFIRMMNEQPQTIATLPPLEDGVADKIILLHAQPMDGGPIDKTQPGWFGPIHAAILDELPAFIHYLLEIHSIPAHITDPSKRYAVMSYHNPEILEMISEDSVESHLLHRMDTEARSRLFMPAAFGDEDKEGDDVKPKPWRGTAAELYEVIANVGTTASQQRFVKTCPSPKVLASQLRTMEKNDPGRVMYSTRGVNGMPVKINGCHYWVIHPKLKPGESPPAPPSVKEDDCF